MHNNEVEISSLSDFPMLYFAAHASLVNIVSRIGFGKTEILRKLANSINQDQLAFIDFQDMPGKMTIDEAIDRNASNELKHVIIDNINSENDHTMIEEWLESISTNFSYSIILSSRKKLRLVQNYMSISILSGLNEVSIARFLRRNDKNSLLGLKHASESEIQEIYNLSFGIPKILKLFIDHLYDSKLQQRPHLEILSHSAEEHFTCEYKQLTQLHIGILLTFSATRVPLHYNEVIQVLADCDTSFCPSVQDFNDLSDRLFLKPVMPSGFFSIHLFDEQNIPIIFPSLFGHSLNLIQKNAARVIKESSNHQSINQLRTNLLEFDYLMSQEKTIQSIELVNTIDIGKLYQIGWYDQLIKRRESLRGSTISKNTAQENNIALGRLYRAVGNYRRSEYLFRLALNDIVPGPNKVECCSRLGIIKRTSGNLDSALILHQDSLKLAQALNDQEHIASALANIGLCEFDMGKFDDGISKQKLALDISTKLKDLPRMSSWTGNIGIGLLRKGHTDDAENIFHRALKMAEQSSNARRQGIWHDNLATVVRESKAFEECLNHHEKAIQFASIIGNKFGETLTRINLSQTYIEMERYEAAIDQLVSCLLLNFPGTSAETKIKLGISLLMVGEYQNAHSLLVSGISDCTEMIRLSSTGYRPQQLNAIGEFGLLALNYSSKRSSSTDRVVEALFSATQSCNEKGVVNDLFREISPLRKLPASRNILEMVIEEHFKMENTKITIQNFKGDNAMELGGITDKFTMNADCLILTAISKELSSILFQFRQFRPAVADRKLNFPYFETTTPNGLHVVAGMPSAMGQLAAASLAHDAITTFNPKAVLLVGIAGGMDKDIPLGDVVVSEQIVDYELGKVTAEGFGPRWSVYRPDAHLLAKAKAWPSQNWPDYIRSKRPTGKQKPALHSGVFLSGNKVIASEETAGALRSVWQKAAAIDMEAAGISSVLWHMEKPPAFLVFKSICDYADSHKNDEWQEYAADAAASCAFSFVLEHLQPSDFQTPQPRQAISQSSNHFQDRALRECLALAYNLTELKILCYDLGVDWEELPQGPKSQMIVELIQYVRRRNIFSAFVNVVNRDRENLLRAYSEETDA